MRPIFILIFFGLLFTQELQVDGNLKVTGTIDAQGNPITNIGEPTGANDAVNMGYLQNEIGDLGGMKPVRIYRTKKLTEAMSFTVPTGKFWIIYLNSGSVSCVINDEDIYLVVFGYYNNVNTTYTIIAIQSDSVILSSDQYYETTHFTIYEYNITGSGTDQGLDYVEP